jgi:glycosyltransferase involved in cell wall biosynthesis
MLPPPPRPTAELDGDGNTQSADVDGTEVLEEKDDADTYVSHVKALLGSRFARVHTTERLCEALACGTIPIITKADGVDLANYEDPLVEGNHYLFLSDEADIDTYVETYIERLGVGLETQMRDAGRAYYERNCSPDGFFRKLMRRYFD